jgi:hypothetical protein
MFGFDETREIVSDNTPTERFDAPQAAGGEPAVRGPNRLLYVLIALGLALLLALITVIVLMLTRGNGQLVAAESPSPNPGISAGPSVSASSAPSVSESEPPSPSASQTKAAPKPDTKPHFTTFNVPKEESGCSKADNFAFYPTVKVTWFAVNAESVWFVQGTDDAADSQYLELPKKGDQDDFPNNSTPQFPCNGQPATYTLTIVGTDGSHYSKHWTVKDTSHY